MKLSSHTVLLSVALAATAETVDSSSRNLFRNRKTKQRNLIKVDSTRGMLEDVLQFDDTELVQALVADQHRFLSMSMSMSMPSSDDGGDAPAPTPADPSPPAPTTSDTTPEVVAPTMAPMESTEAPVAMVGDLPAPTPLEAPTGNLNVTDEETEAPSSSSRRNIGLATTIAIALTIVPYIL